MSSPTNPHNTGDQGDPWEQLAEDLFGLEYGKEHGSREPSPAVTQPVAPAAAVSPPDVHVEIGHEPREAASRVEAEPPNRHDETALPTEPAVVEPIGIDAAASPEKCETSQPAAGGGSAQDSYWDALANWNWDESEGPASKAKSDSAGSVPSSS